MEKISLEMKVDTTQVICALYNEKKDKMPLSGQDFKGYKAIISLMSSITDRLEKKLIDKREKKQFKMSFKYYEAYSIRNFINENIDFFNTKEQNYYRVCLLNLFNQIDEKL